MKKRIALISDIHGNLEALEAILNDIKNQDVDEIICLGDTIGIGPNSKECIDLLIDNNIKSVLGNHEIYLLKGTDFDSTIVGEEKEHFEWIKNSLTNKEIDYIKKCPLYYNININYDDSSFNKKYVLCHYLINNESSIYPFEKNNLKEDINLWKKYNSEDITYFIGHLHEYFDPNEVNGISNDSIEESGMLTNIELVESAGCSKDDYARYTILEISKSIKVNRVKVKYDREKFINNIISKDFPDKTNILKMFYGINNNDLAKVYSEGSKELYNCLLELWKNNFTTIGCCKEHDNHTQYIGLNRNNNTKIIQLLSKLDKDDITISFLNNHVSIKKNKNEDIYDNILNALKNINNNENINIDKEIENSIKFIDNNDYKYVNIHHYYFEGKLNKYINTSDLDLINCFKEKYKYEIINEKLPMYHFIIK